MGPVQTDVSFFYLLIHLTGGMNPCPGCRWGDGGHSNVPKNGSGLVWKPYSNFCTNSDWGNSVRDNLRQGCLAIMVTRQGDAYSSCGT